MTRKDFKIIAHAMNASKKHAIYQKEPAVRDAHALICLELANSLSKTNDAFDYSRFLSACGLSDETIKAL